MGQVGAAGDNAAMESFFSLLQKNVLDRRRWATRDELRIAFVHRDRERNGREIRHRPDPRRGRPSAGERRGAGKLWPRLITVAPSCSTKSGLTRPPTSSLRCWRPTSPTASTLAAATGSGGRRLTRPVT